METTVRFFLDSEPIPQFQYKNLKAIPSAGDIVDFNGKYGVVLYEHYNYASNDGETSCLLDLYLSTKDKRVGEFDAYVWNLYDERYGDK